MISCIYNEQGKFQLVEKDIPQAKHGSAIVKILATSICGTDFRTYINGSNKIQAGTTLGHEFCGKIIEINGEIPNFKIGDIVSAAPALGCGTCYMCQKNHTNMCDSLKTFGYQFDGSFAEYMEIPAHYFEMNNVNHVPANVTPEAAALAEPMACAVNAQDRMIVETGDNVVIFGSGFIGCTHAELAKAAGANRVIMIEPNEARRNAASQMVPFVHMISSDGDWYEQVMGLTDHHGADVAIVACSVGIAQENALKIIAKRGRVSLFGGLPGEGKGFVDSNIIHYKEVGVFGVHASTPAQNKKMLQWISEGKLDCKKYITKTYALSDIFTAMEDIKSGMMKAVIVF